MKITTIQEANELCDTLANLMVEKGVKSPTAAINLKSGDQSHVHIRSDWSTKPFNGKDYHIFSEGTLGDQIEAAAAYINALMSPEEVVSHEYLRRVSSAIDYATEHSIDDKHVAPLRGVSKAMTDNLLSVDKPANNPPERINA